MKKWLIRTGIVVVLVALGIAGYGYYTYRSHGFGRSPVFEHEPPVLPELARPALLVFSKTNSFIHKDAIPAAEAMFREMASKNGWSLYITKNGAIHNAEDLAKFDGIVWNNVTGNVLTPEQRDAFSSYLQNGGGWVGFHGTGDASAEADWPWYRENLIGAMFIGHPMKPQFQEATIRIEAPDDPVVRHLGESWVRTDEWYSFASSPRKQGMNILATLDEKTYSPVFFSKDISMGDDHPIIWKNCVGRGRIVYSALGHTAESYSEPKHVDMLEAAVKWTAGLDEQEAEFGCEDSTME